MTIIDELKDLFARRECLIQKTERTEEEQAELRYLTRRLAMSLPVENALALAQDEQPTRPELPQIQDDE